MEAQLLTIFVGIVAFIVSRLTKKRPRLTQLLSICLSTISVTALIYPFGAADVQYLFQLPLWLTLFSGFLAGLMLSLAHRTQFFTRSGFRYSATILLALIHAFIIVAVILGLKQVSNPTWLFNPSWTAFALPVLLISFLKFFGFALLERLASRGGN